MNTFALLVEPKTAFADRVNNYMAHLTEYFLKVK